MGVKIAFAAEDRGVSRVINSISMKLGAMHSSASGVSDKLTGLSSKRLNINTTQATNNLGQVNDSLKSIEANMQKMETRASRLQTAIVSAFAILPVAAFGTAAVSTASKYEILEARLQTVLGGADQASEAIERIQKAALDTPFGMDVLTDGFLGLAASGNKLFKTQEQITEFTSVMADFAAVSGKGDEGFKSIARVMTKTAGIGKFQAEQLEMLQDAGVPLALVAETMGVSMANFYEMSQAGELTFERIYDVMLKLTAQGGRFHGASVNQMNTLQGAFSNLGDAVASFYSGIIRDTGLSKIIIKNLQRLTAAIDAITQPTVDFMKRTAVIVNWTQAVIVGAIVGTINLIKSVSSGLWNKVAAPFVELFNNLKKLFLDLYIYLVGGSIWPDTMKGIVDWAYWLASSISTPFKLVFNYIVQSVKGIGSFFSSILGPIGGTIAAIIVVFTSLSAILSTIVLSLAPIAVQVYKLKGVFALLVLPLKLVFFFLSRILWVGLLVSQVLSLSMFFKKKPLAVIAFFTIFLTFFSKIREKSTELQYHILDVVHSLSGGLLSWASSGLSAVTNAVYSFAASIKNIFYDLYIYIVGGSVWPDTIMGVVDWAQKLVSLVGSAIGRFATYVGSTFLDILKSVKQFFTSGSVSIGGKSIVWIDAINNIYYALIAFSLGMKLFFKDTAKLSKSTSRVKSVALSLKSLFFGLTLIPKIAALALGAIVLFGQGLEGAGRIATRAVDVISNGIEKAVSMTPSSLIELWDLALAKSSEGMTKVGRMVDFLKTKFVTFDWATVLAPASAVLTSISHNFESFFGSVKSLFVNSLNSFVAALEGNDDTIKPAFTPNVLETVFGVPRDISRGYGLSALFANWERATVVMSGLIYIAISKAARGLIFNAIKISVPISLLPILNAQSAQTAIGFYAAGVGQLLREALTDEIVENDSFSAINKLIAKNTIKLEPDDNFIERSVKGIINAFRAIALSLASTLFNRGDPAAARAIAEDYLSVFTSGLMLAVAMLIPFTRTIIGEGLKAAIVGGVTYALAGLGVKGLFTGEGAARLNIWSILFGVVSATAFAYYLESTFTIPMADTLSAAINTAVMLGILRSLRKLGIIATSGKAKWGGALAVIGTFIADLLLSSIANSLGSDTLAGKITNAIRGVITGALAGASIGVFFGPWGILAGAIIGALVGALSTEGIWDAVKSFYDNGVSQFANWVVNTSLTDKFLDLLSMGIGNWQKVGSWIKEGIKYAVDSVANAWEEIDLAERIKSTWATTKDPEALKALFADAAVTFWETLKQSLTEGAGSFYEWSGMGTAIRAAIEVGEVFNALVEVGRDMGKTLADNLIEGFTSVLDKIKEVISDAKRSAIEGMNSVKDYVTNTTDSAVRWWNRPRTGNTSTEGGTTPDGFATGGFIVGPGSGTSDSILARLSNGEFIVNAKATKNHLGLLEAINAGKLPKFAQGGLAGKIQDDLGVGLPSPVEKNPVVAYLDTHVKPYLVDLTSQGKGTSGHIDDLVKATEEANDTKETSKKSGGLGGAGSGTSSGFNYEKEIRELTKTSVSAFQEWAVSATGNLLASFEDTLNASVAGRDTSGFAQNFANSIREQISSTLVNAFTQGMWESLNLPLMFGEMFQELSSWGLTKGKEVAASLEKGVQEGAPTLGNNLQVEIDNFGLELNTRIGAAMTSIGLGSDNKIFEEFATNSAEAVKESFKEGLTEAVISGDVMGGLESIANMFTMEVMNTFSNSLVNAVWEAFNLEDIFAGIFTNVDGFGSKVGSVITSSATQGVEASAPSLTSGLTGILGGLFKGAGSMLTGAFKFIGAMFGGGFASGGLIAGPGSGTSDSILAAVSNGEYIINAASTRKYLPILEAINKGSLPAFALGGPVGNLPADLSSSRESKRDSQQVFNINITGDISRQTRSEIIKMLPEIANGVRGVDRERGRK